ncbi:MAG: S8 family serine peptidase [Nodosilinea sp. LVE1205-7]
MLSALAPVTSQTVSRFYADPAVLYATADRLRAEGFEVLAVGNTSISIAAEPHIYQRAFQTTLKAFECPVIKEFAEQTTATFINSLDNKPFGEIDLSHTHWTSVLAGIAINEPAYYFRTEETPSGLPPQTRQTYLSVPDQIAEGLNAKAVHQQGLKGDGVKVVMVDTGWYRHPFFSQNNYQGRVVLAPGSTDAEADDHGHGTGESANLFAVAPHVELTVVKADVALDGKSRNVNSIAAFKRAVDLRPDIISCSWGSDQRSHQLSPYTRALGAVVADAVRRGIIVIFSAGNGHLGFPAQHPDVIAAGGVYRHLEGPLKGQLEASSYASGFISPVYPGRVVPDVCGLVGQLPRAAYILLPIPPGSPVDWGCSLGDGTDPTDGWAAFSGTSAAAPQIAGICALMKQLDPGLSPAQAKEILRQTAIDVMAGACSRQTGGHRAIQGPDPATGYGLADAARAIQTLKTGVGSCSTLEVDSNKGSAVAFQSSLVKPALPRIVISPRRKPNMSSNNYPKLSAKLDEILCEFEEILRDKISKDEIEEVRLSISEENFVPRSPETNIVLALVDSLKSLKVANKRTTDKKIKTEVDEIKKKHVLAARSLLKIQSHQELATRVLIAAIESSDDEISETSTKALGEFSTKITKYSINNDLQYVEIFPAKTEEFNFSIKPYGNCLWEDREKGIAVCDGNGKGFLRLQLQENGNWIPI